MWCVVIWKGHGCKRGLFLSKQAVEWLPGEWYNLVCLHQEIIKASTRTTTAALNKRSVGLRETPQGERWWP